MIVDAFAGVLSTDMKRNYGCVALLKCHNTALLKTRRVTGNPTEAAILEINAVNLFRYE
jgi:hypothetical protein